MLAGSAPDLASPLSFTRDAQHAGDAVLIERLYARSAVDFAGLGRTSYARALVLKVVFDLLRSQGDRAMDHINAFIAQPNGKLLFKDEWVELAVLTVKASRAARRLRSDLTPCTHA